MNQLMREIGKNLKEGNIHKYVILKNVYDILRKYNVHIFYVEQKKEWMKMNTIFENEIDIPHLPNTLRPYHIDALIRCGAIPKKDLIVGRKYYGTCRNATEAVWLGTEFEHLRIKFHNKYKEKINHFEDDDGHDLFVPIKIIEEVV